MPYSCPTPAALERTDVARESGRFFHAIRLVADFVHTLAVESPITHEDEWHVPCVQIEASASARVDYTDDGLEVL